jgi:DNA-binding NarL/FixJ family response regulator
MTRILIADDHDVVRSGLKTILEEQDGWKVVGEAADGPSAVEGAIATKPDVAILDYGLPRLNGIEATRQIRERCPSTEVLIFTMHDADALIREALEAGARGFLLKSDAKRFLVAAVESLASHNPFFTGRVSETLLGTYLAKAHPQDLLTVKEKAVLRLIAEGHPNREISEILGVSAKTIESHRASLLKKLKADSTAALIRYAVRSKLIDA